METVYLLHFSSPYKRARHYLGWTMHNLEFRLAHHANGTGAGLTRAAAAAGITWQVTRTWVADHDFERRLHDQHNNARLCPVCNPEGWARRAKSAHIRALLADGEPGELDTPIYEGPDTIPF